MRIQNPLTVAVSSLLILMKQRLVSAQAHAIDATNSSMGLINADDTGCSPLQFGSGGCIATLTCEPPLLTFSGCKVCPITTSPTRGPTHKKPPTRRPTNKRIKATRKPTAQPTNEPTSKPTKPKRTKAPTHRRPPTHKPTHRKTHPPTLCSPEEQARLEAEASVMLKEKTGRKECKAKCSPN